MRHKEIPDNAIVRLIDLPPGIGGAIMEDEDGFVSIYINSRHGYDAQLDDLDHELTHVLNDDLHNDDDIRTIEARANQKPSPLGKVSALALTDEVAAKLLSIPNLIRARDLLPSTQLPHRSGEVAEHSEVDRAPRSPAIQLSPHQARLILNALSDLDRSFFRLSTYEI